MEDSKNKINKQSTHQLHAYAGHDSTVSNLLIALGVWDEQIPTYNMLALLEMHESKKGNFYFKVPTYLMKLIKVVILFCIYLIAMFYVPIWFSLKNILGVFA